MRVPCQFEVGWFLHSSCFLSRVPSTGKSARSSQARLLASPMGTPSASCGTVNPVRVRLDGIDCPETRQDFSERARQLTSSLTFGEVVSVDVRDIDQYGRLVAPA